MSEEMIEKRVAKAIWLARFVRVNPDKPDSDEEYALKLARAALSAYNPDERLREALVALADAADKCGEAPHFIVQPFLNVYREHGETIAGARSALSPLPRGDDT